MPETITTPKRETMPLEGIRITSAALTEFQKLLSEKDLGDEYGLRVGIKGGGCYGFSYLIGFDKKTEQDTEYDIGGMKVFMQKSHSMYLMGMEIDFYNDLNNRGFVFNNPNATQNCGCGNSFSA